MTQAQWLSLAVCGVLALCHFFAGHVRAVLRGWRTHVASFSGGAAAAYVFLRLFPELEVDHEGIGEKIHALVLLGFVLLFAIDTLLARGDEDSTERFSLRIALGVVYNLLLTFTMSEQLSMSPLTTLAYSVGLGLHVLVVDVKLIEEFGLRAYRVWGRFLLVASLAAGWALSALTQAPKAALDVVTALMAGFIVYTVFGEELPQRTRVRVRWFIIGSLAYFLLDTLARL